MQATTAPWRLIIDSISGDVRRFYISVFWPLSFTACTRSSLPNSCNVAVEFIVGRLAESYLRLSFAAKEPTPIVQFSLRSDTNYSPPTVGGPNCPDKSTIPAAMSPIVH